MPVVFKWDGADQCRSQDRDLQSAPNAPSHATHKSYHPLASN